MTDPTGQIPAHVDVISVRLTFGDRKVFDGLSCRFPQGRISVILGASGIGKSCLLKLIACLMRPQYGDIWIGDDEITCMHEREARRMRHKLGMMFQGGALLDSMTVFDNVAFCSFASTGSVRSPRSPTVSHTSSMPSGSRT